MANWNKYAEERLGRLTAPLKRMRVNLFVQVLRLGPHDIILDLGSEDGSCLARFYPYPRNIVLADIAETPMKRGVQRYGLKGYIRIPDDGPLPIGDREFAAVWCNSAIEHVTVPRVELAALTNQEFYRRADEHQRQFAREIARIARAYFVQTPYLHFPVEAHTWLPCVQYIGHRRQMQLGRLCRNLWIKQWRGDFYLYNCRRFREHFPDATSFPTERVLGIPKSLIAVRAS